MEPALGEVEGNARRAGEVVRAARSEEADLVVFPELTLTGYSLGHVTDDVARAVDDPEIAGLAEAADGLGCVVGFAEAGRVHTYNSAAYLERGAVRHVHRKLYLPTYDIWEERKHFTPGDSMRSFDTDIGRVAIEEEWRDVNRFYARMLECYVVFVNRVGDEPGLGFWGGSHVYDPWGELVAEAPTDEPALFSVDLDLSGVRRRRREMPLVKEARLALLSRELERLAAEGGDL